MPPIHEVPFLLAMLVGVLVGMATSALLRNRPHRSTDNDKSLTGRGDILSGMLILAAFATGAFLTYALLGLR